MAPRGKKKAAGKKAAAKKVEENAVNATTPSEQTEDTQGPEQDAASEASETLTQTAPDTEEGNEGSDPFPQQEPEPTEPTNGEDLDGGPQRPDPEEEEGEDEKEEPAEEMSDADRLIEEMSDRATPWQYIAQYVKVMAPNEFMTPARGGSQQQRLSNSLEIILTKELDDKSPVAQLKELLEVIRRFRRGAFSDVYLTRYLSAVAGGATRQRGFSYLVTLLTEMADANDPAEVAESRDLVRMRDALGPNGPAVIQTIETFCDR